MDPVTISSRQLGHDHAVGTGTLPEFLAWAYEKKECSRTPTLNAANSTIFIRQHFLTSIQLESN